MTAALAGPPIMLVMTTLVTSVMGKTCFSTVVDGVVERRGVRRR
jgi:hypothetical protein